jgi:hypothetical protein
MEGYRYGRSPSGWSHCLASKVAAGCEVGIHGMGTTLTLADRRVPSACGEQTKNRVVDYSCNLAIEVRD